jgi:hypothetical protein
MTDNIKPFIKAVSPNNDNTIAVLEDWLEMAKSGELISVGLIGKRTGGDWQTAFSSSDNRLEDAAMLIELGLRRLGFAQK